MDPKPEIANINTLAFEELATCLTGLRGYIEDSSMDMGFPIYEFERQFKRALNQPASYNEISSLAGNHSKGSDRKTDLCAWLLCRTRGLNIVGVNSQFWHYKNGCYSSPLMHQLQHTLSMSPDIEESEIQELGKIDKSTIDVVAIGAKKQTIWLCQVVYCNDISISSVHPSGNTTFGELFPESIFNNPTIQAKRIKVLSRAATVLRRAFPGITVRTAVVVLHRVLPDYEIYMIDFEAKNKSRRLNEAKNITLHPNTILDDSMRFRDELLSEGFGCLTTLPARFSDNLLSGMPPCIGGRSMMILSAISRRQLDSSKLALFKEKEISSFLLDDYGLIHPRDKVRHDLVDRLAGQGLLRKYGPHYSLSIKGIARYLYCLAKYTTVGPETPSDVLDYCTTHRHKIVDMYGFV